MHQTLQSPLQAVASSPAYRYYQEVRDWVLGMLSGAQSNSDVPSHYWQQEIAGFDYMLDISPLLVGKVREHYYHLTGLCSSEYRNRLPYNDRLSTVSSVLLQYYWVRHINVLPVSYNQINIPRPETGLKNHLPYHIRHPRPTLRKLKSLALPNKGPNLSESSRHYRHLVGSRRP